MDFIERRMLKLAPRGREKAQSPERKLLKRSLPTKLHKNNRRASGPKTFALVHVIGAVAEVVTPDMTIPAVPAQQVVLARKRAKNYASAIPHLARRAGIKAHQISKRFADYRAGRSGYYILGMETNESS